MFLRFCIVMFLCLCTTAVFAETGISIQQIILDKIASRLDTVRAVGNFRRYYTAGDLANGCLSYGPFFFGSGARERAVNGFPGLESNSAGLGWAGDSNFNLACGGSARAGAGLAAAYTVTTPRGTTGTNNNTLKAVSIQPLLYGSLEFDRAFVDGLLGLAFNRYHGTRVTPGGLESSGNFKGFQLAVKTRVGYVMTLATFAKLPVATLELTPLAGFQYIRATQQQYQETGASDLTVIGRHYSLYQFSFGGRLALVNEPQGFYTEIHANMLIDASRDPLIQNNTLTSFGPIFTTPGFATEKIGANIGASSTLSFADGLLLTTGLDFEGRTNYFSYTGWVRLRWLF